ncbi:hypothetical protein PQG02_11305 [Nostoc sp. UHCC 0926]|uniref:hypothetical protein n=1 Tax=unclassified Nostoc TaxID=2593658 RepID=UPI002362C892|nr:hypothetical protein [Nostoc sp. UHCC 0926]WDD34859.1 hypothetical protein PQG02_11305 [Nostoc sp. UHCC 0926]
MEGNNRKYNSHVEINELIDDAVNSAMARRKKALDSEEALLDLSNEEAKSVAGGITRFVITTGIIATDI